MQPVQMSVDNDDVGFACFEASKFGETGSTYGTTARPRALVASDADSLHRAI